MWDASCAAECPFEAAGPIPAPSAPDPDQEQLWIPEMPCLGRGVVCSVEKKTVSIVMCDLR